MLVEQASIRIIVICSKISTTSLKSSLIWCSTSQTIKFATPIRDALPAHHRSFAPEWQCTTQEAEQQTAYTLQQSVSFCNTCTWRLSDIQIGGLAVALQNPQTKL